MTNSPGVATLHLSQTATRDLNRSESGVWVMFSRASCLAVLLATTAVASVAHAYPSKEPEFDASALSAPYAQPAPWPGLLPVAPMQRMTMETGMRYWFSSGRYKLDLYDSSGSLNVSRLTYDGSVAQTAEAFWRFDYNRTFLKGNLGGGSIAGGHMSDQDFQPVTSPESNTRQEMKDSSVRYVNVDLGYTMVDTGYVGLGAFVGYGYWAERLNTFGCAQQIGGAICSPVAIGTDVNTLNGEPAWNMLRLGASGSWEFYPGLKLSADAAYVRGWFAGKDFHVLRPDINGTSLDGTGNGFMVESILSWQVMQGVSIGVGGRWWHIEADGDARFDALPGSSYAAQPIKIEQDRYGVFVQGAYKFGDRTSGAAVPFSAFNGAGASWTGFYAGPTIGYGSSFSKDDSATLAPTTANGSVLVGAGAIPASIPVSNGGVTAGVTVGYNWQFGRGVLGAEGDFSYAHIAGANGWTDPATGVTTSVDQSLGWFATLRARFGYLLTSDFMVFGTAGAAFGDVKADASSQQVSSSFPCAGTALCADGSVSKVRIGWTAGAGVEYRINSWSSVKAEALYYDLGSANAPMTDISAGAPANFDANSKFTAGLLRSGINFHW
ncbi:opacity protein-like surface antigen [Bradyrhizobium sp. USDA 4341]